MSVPKDFVKENLKKSKGSTFFGVPIKELTKKELRAIATAGWVAQQAGLKKCSTCLLNRR